MLIASILIIQIYCKGMNQRSTNSICYTEDPLMLKKNLALDGAARAWCSENRSAPVGSYVSNKELELHDNVFATESGDYGYY